MLRWSDVCICLALLGLFLCLVIPSLRSFSRTSDEGWLLDAAPAIALERDFSSYDSVRHPPLTFLTYAFALSDDLDEHDRLIRARSLMLIYPLLLGLLIYLAVRGRLGRSAGAAALAFFCTNPTVLAHSSLITTDVAAATTFLLAFLMGGVALRAGSWQKGIAAGISLGIALLAKYSCVMLLPILLLMTLFPALCGPVARHGNGRPPGLSRRLLALLVLLAVALLVLNLAYGFQGAGGVEYTPVSAKLGALLPGSSTPPLLPASYVIGFDRVLEVTEQGHPAYFLGEFTLFNRWYFTPIAFLLKEPLPFLLALLLGLLFLLRRKEFSFLLLPLLLPALSFSLWNENFVGLRHLLVVYPFLFLLAAAPFSARTPRTRLLWLLPALQLASVLAVAPHHLAYFNEACGGPRAGSEYLLDSNFDWGQDHGAAMEFVARSEERIQVAPGELPALGQVLVSANDLRGYPGTWDGHAWLEPFTPVLEFGYTHLLYDLRLADFERSAAADRARLPALAWAYREAGESARALELFQEVGDPAAEALLLLDAGRSDAAWQVLHDADMDAKKDERFQRVAAVAAILRGDPEQADLHLLQATVARVEGRLLDTHLADDPPPEEPGTTAQALNLQGYALWSAGDPVEAALRFRAAAEAEPRFADSFGNLSATAAGLAEGALRAELTGGRAAADGSRRRVHAAEALEARAHFLERLGAARARKVRRVTYRGHQALVPAVPLLPVPGSRALELLAAVPVFGPAELEQLGILHLSEGDELRALEALVSALRLESRRPRALYHVGLIQFRMRLYALARIQFEQALRFEPNMASAREGLQHLDRHLAAGR